MIVEGINHLMHLVKAIEEEQGRFLVGVLECGHDFVESVPRHVSIEPKSCTLEHVNGLDKPPHVPLGNSIVARHEEDATQEDMNSWRSIFLVSSLFVIGMRALKTYSSGKHIRNRSSSL
jgi:hypothetical protein